MLISMLTGTSTSFGFFQVFISGSPHDLSGDVPASENLRYGDAVRTLSR
jgi:hypothetical protein